jgi:hypothetical protein
MQIEHKCVDHVSRFFRRGVHLRSNETLQDAKLLEHRVTAFDSRRRTE